jgi:hypothetical protein
MAKPRSGTAGTPEAGHGVYWFAALIALVTTAWALLGLIAWAVVRML